MNDFYEARTSAKRMYIVIFLILFFSTLTIILILALSRSIPTLDKEVFAERDLFPLRQHSLLSIEPAKIKISEYNENQKFSQLFVVDLLLLLKAAQEQGQSDVLLKKMNQANLSRLYLLLTYAPFKELNGLEWIATNIKPLLKNSVQFYSTDKYSLGTTNLQIMRSEKVAVLSEKKKKSFEFVSPLSMFRQLTKFPPKLLGNFYSLEQVIAGTSNWSINAYLLFDHGVKRYICRIETQNSVINLSFKQHKLSSFMTLSSKVAFGSMTMWNENVTFNGEFEGILPKYGTFKWKENGKQKSLYTHSIDASLEDLCKGTFEVESEKKGKLAYYTVDKNGVHFNSYQADESD